MKWKEVAERISEIRISLSGLSITYKFTPSEQEIAKRVLNMLGDRRVLFNLPEYEYPAACEKSVQEIRAKLSQELDQLKGNTEIEKNLKVMRGTCRAFLDSVQKNNLIKELYQYPYPAKHWEFVQALAFLRRDFGSSVEFLSIRYEIDIEDGLSSILPPPDETQPTETGP